MTDTPGAVHPPASDPRLRTRFCELVGVEYPIVQTGMGWVAGPRLVAATAEAGGLGVLASATMTLNELDAAIADVRARTERPFGVNLRTDVADVGERIGLMIDAGVRVASFAQAPRPDLGGPLPRCRPGGDAHRRGPPPRREGGRMGRGRRHRPGSRGWRPHRERAHVAPDPGGGRRRRRSGLRRGGRRLLRRARARGRAGLRGDGHRHGDAVPAHPGEPGARRREVPIPRDAGDRHGRLDARSTEPRSGSSAPTWSTASNGPGVGVPCRGRSPTPMPSAARPAPPCSPF